MDVQEPIGNRTRGTSPVPYAHCVPWTNSLIAGGIAGLTAESMLHPFDTVSLRLKVQSHNPPKYNGVLHAWKTIYKEEGLRGYFGGLGTTIVSAPITTAIYFGAYETMKHKLSTESSWIPAPLVHFLAGGFSELACSAVSVPMELVKCRLQLGRNPSNASGGTFPSTQYRHTWHACQSILRSQGIGGLYSGFSACVAVDVSLSALSFVFYEELKLLVSRQRQYELSPALVSVEHLATGSIAGGLAAAMTNPLDVITVRLMTQDVQHRHVLRLCGIMHGFELIYRSEGLRGLWKGTIPRVLNIFPQTGLSFAVYETIKQYLFNGELEAYLE